MKFYRKVEKVKKVEEGRKRKEKPRGYTEFHGGRKKFITKTPCYSVSSVVKNSSFVTKESVFAGFMYKCLTLFY
jgi:hypothetical protein